MGGQKYTSFFNICVFYAFIPDQTKIVVDVFSYTPLPEEGFVGDSSTGGMGDLMTATFLLAASETILPQIVLARETAAAEGPEPDLFSDNIVST